MRKIILLFALVLAPPCGAQVTNPAYIAVFSNPAGLVCGSTALPNEYFVNNTGSGATYYCNGSPGVWTLFGSSGVVGATGATGPSGTNGTNGTTGPTGPAGATGATGTAGAAGATGATGATGSGGGSGNWQEGTFLSCTSCTISHNLNTLSPSCTIYDSGHCQIGSTAGAGPGTGATCIAVTLSQVQPTDVNNLAFTLSTATSGFYGCSGAGGSGTLKLSTLTNTQLSSMTNTQLASLVN